MSYLARNNKNHPSKDKIDDFRHFVDATYCTYLVSDVKALVKYVSEFIPELEVISFLNLIN